MSAITIHCHPDWLPERTDTLDRTGYQLTTTLIGRWLVERLPGIIDDVDENHGDDKVKPDAFWATFEPLPRAGINNPELWIIVSYPEIDGLTAARRKVRRCDLTFRIRELLSGNLLTNCDHLLVPKCEVEVISTFKSEFGIAADCSITHR